MIICNRCEGGFDRGSEGADGGGWVDDVGGKRTVPLSSFTRKELSQEKLSKMFVSRKQQ